MLMKGTHIAYYLYIKVRIYVVKFIHAFFFNFRDLLKFFETSLKAKSPKRASLIARSRKMSLMSSARQISQ